MLFIELYVLNFSGNLNRHKKVKHGLNESTENLEEQAVSFLNELSDRSRPESEGKGKTDNLSETVNSDSDEEKDSDHSTSKSPRKARKSIPRKYTYKRRPHPDDAKGNYSEEDEEEEEEDAEMFEDVEENAGEKKNLRERKRKRYEPERVYVSEDEGKDKGDEDYEPSSDSSDRAEIKRRK
jgi:hypothetical protein